MKLLAIIFISITLGLATFSQTAKPKPAAAKPKPGAANKTSDARAKTTPAKHKPTDPKAKTATQKPKALAPNPKPSPTPSSAEEIEAFTAATEIADPGLRIDALKQFVLSYPKSDKSVEAIELIVTIETGLGNDRLTAGDIAGAMKFYLGAADHAPKPVPDQLFSDTLAKFAANLYFRGARSEAYEIAAIIESKAEGSIGQLLNIAAFYMSVENGSEARRLANRAINLNPKSSAAYQTLGLASRIDFLLDESVSAYEKALELDSESLSARRGLAEMKRSIGRADEAVVLYREILGGDAENLPAETGLILALFDAGNRPEAESELARALDRNPGNIILLAGAAYWYAANNDGEKAINLAQRAIAVDPRFIWSHIALARGHISLGNPVTAEKTLLMARRYGNFPTLEYEIASARAAAGFYREAAEELAKSFSVRDGLVETKLGGRVPRKSMDFTELVGFERRASIFAPTAADTPENSARLKSLLELSQELGQSTPSPVAAARAVDDFVQGDDKMKVHRQLFAGSRLLEKNLALPKVIELIKAAPQSLDAGLDAPDTAAAVMASELYESRSLAAVRGDYIEIPAIAKPTLSAILRGRIEEINGWTYYQMDDPAQAVIHLKRAVSVLPPESAWWQSSSWRLGSALTLAGKEAEALDTYIRTYKSGKPDALRYNTIEALYKRVHGHTLGLEEKIGANPTPQPPVRTVARNTLPIPIALTSRGTVPVQTSLDGQSRASIPTRTPAIVVPTIPVETPIEPIPKSAPEPTPNPTPLPTLERVLEEKKPTPNPELTLIPTATPTTEPTLEETPPAPTPEAVPDPTPKPTVEPTPTPNPLPTEPEPSPTPDVTPEPAKEPTAEPSPTPTPVIEETKSEQPPSPPVSPEPQSRELVAESKPRAQSNELFPPVIITIPPPTAAKSTLKPGLKAVSTNKSAEPETPGEKPPDPEAEPNSASKPPPSSVERPAGREGRPRRVEGVPDPVDIKPCKLTVSEERISLQNGGGDLAVIVGRDDDLDLDGLTAVSTSPSDVSVRREIITGVKSRALFVVRSTSSQAGIYQIKFELPCGSKEVVVRVR